MSIEKDVLQGALAQAITNAIDNEAREKIFRGALIEHLFAEPRGGGNNVLTSAFERALNDATAKLAQEIVNEPENRERIRESFRKALDNKLSNDELVSKIGDKLMQWLRY